MGLFRKKQYDIVCPYCFKKFSTEEVHFRDNVGTPMPKGKVDEKYNKFWKDMGMKQIPNVNRFYVPGEDEGVLERSTEVINGRRYDILIKFTPNNAHPTNTRICPYCHNDLPKSAGKGKSTVIAILGSTQIGKTFYINSLITGLKALANEGFVNQGFELVNVAMNEIYENTKKAIEDGIMNPTPREYIQPIIGEFFNVQTRETAIVSFYDFPGESTTKDIAMYSQGQIENADAFLILFDLTRTQTLFQGWMDGLINELKNKEIDEFAKLVNWGLQDVVNFIENITYSDFCRLLPFDSDDNTDALLDVLINIKTLGNEVKKMKQRKALFGEPPAPQNENPANSLSDILGGGGSGLNTGTSATNSFSEEDALIANYDKAIIILENHKKKLNDGFGRELSDDAMIVLYKLMSSRKKIQTYEDNKKHPNSYFDPVTKRTVNLNSAAQWLSMIYGQAVSDQLSKKPAAIVGTKSDEIFETVVTRNALQQNIDSRYVEGILKKSDKELHKNGMYNIAEGESISGFVERFLLANDNNFKQQVNKYFTNSMYFAVSALGGRYVEEKVYDDKTKTTGYKKVLETTEINPWRVTEPMLWLLFELGLVKGEKNNEVIEK